MTGPSTTASCDANSQYALPVGVFGFGTAFALMLLEPKMAPTQTKPSTLRLHNVTAQGMTLSQSVKPSSSVSGRRRGASLHGNRREHKGGTHSLASPAQGSPSVPSGPLATDYGFFRDAKGFIDMVTPGDPLQPAILQLLALGTADGVTLLFSGPVGLLTTYGERQEIESVYSKLTGGAI